APRGRNVYRYRTLAAVDRHEIRRLIRRRTSSVLQIRWKGTRLVPMVRPLDLDDVGAEVRQVLSKKRAGKYPAHVQDSDVFECLAHRDLPSREARFALFLERVHRFLMVSAHIRDRFVR